MRIIKGLLTAAILAGASITAPVAADDNWPTKPFKVVVPYPAGGSADLVGRLVAKAVSDKFGKPAVVENISGGGTIPGAMAVIKEPADGHTLFMASDGTLNIIGFLMKQLPFNADKDFTPVTVLNAYPHWLIVKQDGKHKDFAGFVKYIQDNPGAVSISINTIGGGAHLALTKWKQENNLDFEIVPYRGSPPAVTDLIGGHTDAHIDVVGSSIPQARAGKVMPIAVLQSTKLKEFPKATVQDYADPKALTVRSNLSVVVKAGTPPEVIDKLYAAVVEGAKKKEFIEALDMLAYPAVLTPPAESSKFLLEETVRYGKLFEISGLEKQ